MQKKAQFDDRIRNLIALAQDGSKHSRTLLFSHICDLFLQKRPMASASQVRMLTDILKELLDQVDLSVRQEVATALNALTSPPEPLINILCEDVIEVSGPLLEKAILPDERLIHIIRYGTEAHQVHISRRFGLSPLVRHELEKAFHDAHGSKLKYSLSELDKLAENALPVMDEETTANILEVLRAQNIHHNEPAPERETDVIPHNIAPETRPLTNPEPVASSPKEYDYTPSQEAFTPGSPISSDDSPLNNISQDDPDVSGPRAAEISREYTPSDATDPFDLPYKDPHNFFPTESAANDFTLPDSSITIPDSSAELTEDIGQEVQQAQEETHRQRDFIRSVADWFWEIDRTGTISFISEEAFTVFGRPASSLIGEDFISLFTLPNADNDNGDVHSTSRQDDEAPQKSFDTLFERRSSFRDIPFYISSQKGDKTLWYISAIAIFDIHTGRFTGFRGSARSTIGDDLPTSHDMLSPQTTPEETISPHAPTTVLKATSQDILPQGDNTYDEGAATELLHNLSHEFRTPLNAIIGFSEMIDLETWGPVNQQYHQNTKNILTAAVQLKEAVNDVLDSAKLDAGLMQIEPESFSLKSVMKNCRENVASMATEKDMHFLDDDKNIDVILYNDKQSVELCLTKIFTSIIKRAHGGESINPSVLINSNAQVRIEIPILGPRIDEKDADKIFQKLQKEPLSSENAPTNGINYEPKISSGFGLSVAQDLAQMIGGTISAHCARGYISHLVLTLSNHDPIIKDS